MNSVEIKQEIESIIAHDSYPSWTIGLTDNPTFTKALHRNPECWHHWRADTAMEAKSVHNYFLSREMKTDNSSGKIPNYVYIY
ncbi:MAG: hypothetical protein ACE5G1_16695 [bacterium]